MKNRFHGFLLLLFSVVPVVRVAILKDVPAVTIQGKELRYKVSEAKPTRYYLDSPATVEPSLEGFQIGEQIIVSPFLKITSLESPITVGEKSFEGTIEIRQTKENQLLVLNEIPVEKYLLGALPGEIPSGWPLQALKAQAVAARTYALFRQGRKGVDPNSIYDLESDTADQIYLGMNSKTHHPAIAGAIEQTKGEVLWYLGLFPAYFHSCCGGETEIASKVWGRKEISKSVIDRFCEKAPFRNWVWRLSPKDLFAKLKGHGLQGVMLKAISTERYETSPRNATVALETDVMLFVMKATDFRRILGEEKLMSTWFDVKLTPQAVVFAGHGYGHGVGLCQWGAKAMAERGTDYKSILKFYYPKAVIRKMY